MMIKPKKQRDDRNVTVRAFSRIHLGLLQISEEYSSRFGGIGIAISSPGWRVTFTRSKSNFDDTICGSRVNSEHRNTIIEALNALRKAEVIDGFVQAEVEESVGAHIGLGSKTSLLMAVISGVSQTNRKLGALDKSNIISLGQALGRGGVSRVGVNLALNGGVVLDFGHRNCGETWLPSGASTCGCGGVGELFLQAPQWPVMLATPKNTKGLHGLAEQRFFQSVLPLARKEADRASAVCMYEILPSIATNDFRWFCYAINLFQEYGLKAREWDLQSSESRRMARVLRESFQCGVALSSVGPTVAIFTSKPEDVETDISQNFDGYEAIRTAIVPNGVATL
jgi:beta-RFAP synthase